MQFATLARTAALAALVATAVGANDAGAESTTVNGAGTLNAPAHLDFSIVIPRFLNFRVGTVGATIDQITFSPTAAVVGNSAPIAGTGGDAAGGSGANVSVLGNGGQVTITESNNSAGAGLKHATLADAINYSQITTSSSDSTNLNAPTLSNAGGNTATPVLTASNVTNRSAIWTYAYANTTVPSAGTYGTSANGGRVTYTASMP